MIDKLPGRGMHMSNEAQALAGEPQSHGDNEYKAFLAVLSSSARGRAFLAEHARRSRLAETEMLLGAIERIEATLAEQRAQAAAAAPLPAAPGAAPPTALAAIAAQAIAAAERDMPQVKVIKAGSGPQPSHYSGEDFTGAEAVADAAAPEPAPPANVMAEIVPPEHTAPPGTPVADALAQIVALSEEERLALFS